MNNNQGSSFGGTPFGGNPQGNPFSAIQFQPATTKPPPFSGGPDPAGLAKIIMEKNRQKAHAMDTLTNVVMKMRQLDTEQQKVDAATAEDARKLGEAQTEAEGVSAFMAGAGRSPRST